ncbi:hypothetical protein BDV06DRAFT_216420 [Aspergillus oleicola]
MSDISSPNATFKEGQEEENGAPSETSAQYIQGSRLYIIIAALCMCLFLTNLEIPIVSTALISITNDLSGLDKVYWITTAYMLGYVGVLIISAKISDLVGRKSTLLTVIFIFVVFSGACGAAQTMEQLIIFRALQGIGGAGNYALCVAITVELVPPAKYAKYTSLMSIAYAFSLLLGPVMGGAISENSTWRWIFLLNVPPAILAGVVLVLALPNGFSHHNERAESLSPGEYVRQIFRKADILGSGMLLVATTLLVTALEEANHEFEWNSAFTIVLFVVSGVTWILFLVWERWITLYSEYVEPVFPWRFAENRVCVGMLLNAIFLGAVWFTTMFQLPQRFQIVNQLSPLQAAVRFIPFTLAAPFGSVLAPAIGKMFKVPLLYLVIFASAIQVISYVLLGTLSESLEISASQYGYQILGGLGCGINISLLILMTPFTVEQRDNAVAMGAVAQFRVMGGCMGIAIATAVANEYLQSNLSLFLGAGEVNAILRSAEMLSTLPLADQSLVRGVYSASYNLQMKILAGFAGGQVLTSLLMWQKSQLVV